MHRTGRGAARAALAAVVLVLTGCGADPAPVADAPVGPSTTSAGPGSSSPAPTGPAPPSGTPGRTADAGPSTGADPAPSPSASRTPPATPTRRPAPEPPGWVGDRRNAVAFAPLDDPGDVTVEGRVDAAEAWSTSKVLVVAAVLDTVAGGEPDRLTRDQRRLVERALSRSDGDAVARLRAAIPGSPGRAMTAVLRSVGDRTTTAPDRYEGLMVWSVREQVRFMAALAAGDVVSPAASAYLLDAMRPVAYHAWGLGTIGARSYKGGWLRADRVSRQMGLVDGYAVALVTDGVGPAVVQTDGDSAHVRQMDRLAAELQERLASERRRAEGR
ncbi:MAG: hypothetical protein AVDCRST_MAG48-771 [uncultured Friedmanniella sp.]|uniref:Beta-lactamase class A-like and penicillin binding proteins (PBPs) superfamily n=1 Tax=uncultured Friedmanniella sp. TaxID=335381 RepID=A0A6J4K277_9ACTN|nr:MAG: hypothetical protein AVDCRST_MAG48-771 [uncultured Friedmanniella sp.]